MLLLPMQNSSFSLVLLMYPYNLSALPIKTNGAFPLLCCDKIEHNEWHLESAKLQASRSYHVLLLQCHLLTFFTKQNVYLICSFLRMHLLKSRSPGGGGSIYIYTYYINIDVIVQSHMNSQESRFVTNICTIYHMFTSMTFLPSSAWGTLEFTGHLFDSYGAPRDFESKLHRIHGTNGIFCRDFFLIIEDQPLKCR